MSKRVLLTGVGGSIGCHVLAHLMHNTNWTVVGVDSFRHKGLTDRVVETMRHHPDWQPRLTVLTHDLTAPISEVLERRIGSVDYVLNVASLSDVHDSILHPAEFINGNVALAVNMLEYARRVKPAVFLQVSSDEVYGPTDGKTLHAEWSAIVPSNAYSASKAAQEAAAIAYWRSYGVPLMLVNLMNNFGEMQNPNKFPAIVQRKVRRGETVDIHTTDGKIGSRSYIHSRNCADALLFIIKDATPYQHREGLADRPERFNIVGDRQVDNYELAQMIADFIDKPLKFRKIPAARSRPGHDIHYGLDGSKLAALGWRSPRSLEESLRSTVEWYEEHPEWLEPR